MIFEQTSLCRIQFIPKKMKPLSRQQMFYLQIIPKLFIP